VPALGPKHKPKVKANSTFKVILMQPPNTQTGMKMWLPETVVDGVDCLRNFPTPRLREFSDLAAKRL
jgi:hypothetical protein